MASEKRVDGFVNGSTDHQDEQHEDDEKMEQFFALIRNFHKRKDELRQKEEMKVKSINKKRRLDHKNNDQVCCSWVPTFEWADFSEEIEFRGQPVIFPSTYNKKGDNKNQDHEDDKLDLKLTL